MQTILTRLLAAVLWSLLAAGPLRAQGDPAEGLLQAQLLPGWTTPQGTRMVALRLMLAPGWKTYWRSPGDAGIPPLIDWSASRNLASIQVHWPRPHVYDSGGLRTIGYKDELILPLELKPRRAGSPIHFSAEMDLGICDTICVPATLRFDTVFDGPGAADPVIEGALSDRPVAAVRAGVGPVTCRFEPIADGLRVTAAIRMPSAGGAEVAVVETSDPRVWVSEADLLRSGETLSVVADLVPPRGTSLAVDRAGMRFTILGNRQAVDITGCAPG